MKLAWTRLKLRWSLFPGVQLLIRSLFTDVKNSSYYPATCEDIEINMPGRRHSRWLTIRTVSIFHNGTIQACVAGCSQEHCKGPECICTVF